MEVFIIASLKIDSITLNPFLLKSFNDPMNLHSMFVCGWGLIHTLCYLSHVMEFLAIVQR